MTKRDDADELSQRSALSRWSRRKAAARDEVARDELPTHLPEDPPPGNLPATLPDTADPQSPDALSTGNEPSGEEPPVLTDADMPDIETLGEGSDFSQFMSPGVSDALRKRALARLYRLPFFSERDGLDDYDEDFRTFLPLGDTVTSDMKFMERRKRELEQERLDEEAAAKRELAESSDEDEAGETSARDDSGDGVEGDPDNDSDVRQRASGDELQPPSKARTVAGIDNDTDDDVGDAEDEML